MNIITREAAQAAGQIRYFTGEPCQHGHVVERRVISGVCVECDRLRDQEWRKKTKLARDRKLVEEELKFLLAEYWEQMEEHEDNPSAIKLDARIADFMLYWSQVSPYKELLEKE
jgi:hypothetical protein